MTNKIEDELIKVIKDLKQKDAINLLIELIDLFPQSFQERLLCQIKTLENIDYQMSDEMINLYEKTINEYDNINNYYFDIYKPSDKLLEVFDDTRLLIEKSVLYKQYDLTINLFEKLIYTKYQTKSSIKDFKNNLNISLYSLSLYASYAILMSNDDEENKFNHLYQYLDIVPDFDFERVEDVGIEKIANFDEICKRWQMFLKKKKEE